MKILFLCKYNRFRSRVAEAYFKKINKNKKIVVKSAGVIKGDLPLAKEQVETAKKFGINILGKPKGLSMRLLKEVDMIIIVADDVPKEIFYFRGKCRYNVRKWNIPDVGYSKDMKGNKKAVVLIIKEVEKLVKELSNSNQ